MTSNADKLKALRYTLGLTQAQMAEKIGVSKTSIKHCENGYSPQGKTKTHAQSRIKAFLEVQDISPAVIAESKLAIGLGERQKSLHKHFTKGKCYRIYYDGYQNSYDRKFLSTGTSSWEQSCIFMFLRKDGIHHVFREVRGGWIRTYTDAQLVGKNIQEVEP